MDRNEWLEAYFDNSIVEVQRKELEAQAEENPDLAFMMRTHRNALVGMEALGEEKLRIELSRMVTDWQDLKSKQKSRQMRVTMIVGIAAILIGMGSWFVWRNMRNGSISTSSSVDRTNSTQSLLPEPSRIKTMQPQALAVRYFSPTDIQLKGIRSKHKSSATQASEAFAQGDYQTTIQLLEPIAGAYNKIPESLRLTLGMAYLADKQPTDASRMMLPLLHGSSPYDDKARWYLALAYFQQGNIVQGMGLMEEASRFEGHYQQEAAQRFLGQLMGETGI